MSRGGHYSAVSCCPSRRSDITGLAWNHSATAIHPAAIAPVAAAPGLCLVAASLVTVTRDSTDRVTGPLRVNSRDWTSVDMARAAVRGSTDRVTGSMAADTALVAALVAVAAAGSAADLAAADTVADMAADMAAASVVADIAATDPVPRPFVAVPFGAAAGYTTAPHQ